MFIYIYIYIYTCIYVYKDIYIYICIRTHVISQLSYYVQVAGIMIVTFVIAIMMVSVKITPLFARTSTMQSSSRHCSPAPDLVFSKLILPRAFLSGGMLFKLFTDLHYTTLHYTTLLYTQLH